MVSNRHLASFLTQLASSHQPMTLLAWVSVPAVRERPFSKVTFTTSAKSSSLVKKWGLRRSPVGVRNACSPRLKPVLYAGNDLVMALDADPLPCCALPLICPNVSGFVFTHKRVALLMATLVP
ncbi:hypothetical protein J6590_066861 [Homalodisca vitripennis]|nr:hypothetical protein J6590_066861 [Homalodisca vitripennis]